MQTGQTVMKFLRSKHIREALEWAKTQDDPDPSNEVEDMFADRTIPTISNDETNTKTMNYIEAITNGLDELMENDENVFMMGEDIGVFEGTFKATKGLFNKYGPIKLVAKHNSNPCVLFCLLVGKTPAL